MYNDRQLIFGAPPLEDPRPKRGVDLSGGGFAAAQPYELTQIDVPESTFTAANANSTHAIAGEYNDANGDTHGFVWTKKDLTSIDVPEADMTTVNGINDLEEVVGSYADVSGVYGFLGTD